MIKPCLSPVAPRVKTVGSGAAVLLTDQLELLLDSEYPILVRVDGEFSQQTLAHVAEYLKSDVESGKLRIQGLPAVNVVPIVRLCSTREQLPPDDFVDLLEDQFEQTFRLLSWGRDEFIEYLLSRHPQQCRSVMERLQSADLSFAGGSPLVWTVILDRMADDSSLSDFGEIMFTEVRLRIDDVEKFNAVADQLIALRLLTNSGQILSLLPDHPAALLRKPAVKQAIATQRFHERLRNDNGSDLIELVSYDLSTRVVQIGRQLADDRKTCAKLAELFLAVAESAPHQLHLVANCATLLALADPDWRPQGESLYLRGATFSEVKWPEIDLCESDLRRVDFGRADLSFAELRDCRLSFANFANCSLRGADISSTENDSGESSDEEVGGDERRKQGGGKRQSAKERAKRRIRKSRRQKYKKILASQPSTVCKANFDGCDLTNANVSGRAFSDSSFRNAKLRGVNGRRFLNLVGTDLSGADLTGGQFAEAIFQATNFATVVIDECNFRKGSLVDSKLVDVRARDVNFSHAKLRNVEWTGSQLLGCDFFGADLTAGRVAEISWEDCDLREADLRGLDFHMGSSRSGMVDSPYPSHGTRTGFYTDDYADQHFKRAEEIRKASLVCCDLRGANITGVDFYLVDLRGAQFDEDQRQQFTSCGAILDDNQL